MKFHAVMIDETGCEFGADVEADTRNMAYNQLEVDYPESRVAQLESPEDTREREARMMRHIERGGDWDDDGSPIFPAGYGDWEDEYMDFEDDTENEKFEAGTFG